MFRTFGAMSASTPKGHSKFERPPPYNREFPEENNVKRIAGSDPPSLDVNAIRSELSETSQTKIAKKIVAVEISTQTAPVGNSPDDLFKNFSLSGVTTSAIEKSDMQAQWHQLYSMNDTKKQAQLQRLINSGVTPDIVNSKRPLTLIKMDTKDQQIVFDKCKELDINVIRGITKIRQSTYLLIDATPNESLKDLDTWLDQMNIDENKTKTEAQLLVDKKLNDIYRQTAGDQDFSNAFSIVLNSAPTEDTATFQNWLAVRQRPLKNLPRSSTSASSGKGQIKRFYRMKDITRYLPPNFGMSMVSHGQEYVEFATSAKERFMIPASIWLLHCVPEGDTLLAQAASQGNLSFVEMLLETPGILVNAKNAHGNTALMIAALIGKIDVLRALLKTHGIDVNVANEIGNTALMLAAWNGNLNTIKTLLQAYDYNSEKININAANSNKATVLMYATLRCDVDIVRELLKVDDIEVNATNCERNTALILASTRNLEIVKALLERPEININAVNNDGETALLSAVSVENIGVINTLLDRPEIDVDVVNKEGRTALDLVDEYEKNSITWPLIYRLKKMSHGQEGPASKEQWPSF